MTRSAKPACPQDTEQLTAAVQRLTDEIAVLRQALDEFREIFRWAVNNDRLCVPNEQPESELSVALNEKLAGLADEVAEAVSEQLKRELSALRNSLDDFSTDVTWAARQIRNGSHRADDPNSGPVLEAQPVENNSATASPPPTSNITASRQLQRSMWSHQP